MPQSFIPQGPRTYAKSRTGMGGPMTSGEKETERMRVGAGTRGADGGTKKAVSGKNKASKSGSGESKRTKNSGKDKKNSSIGGEAQNVMGTRTSSIVGSLLERTMRGDAKSAQMLVGLSDKEAEAMEVLEHGPLRSQALAWAAEPQWQDEVDSETAETGSGSRESE